MSCIARGLAFLWTYGPDILIVVGILCMFTGSVALLLGMGPPR